METEPVESPLAGGDTDEQSIPIESDDTDGAEPRLEKGTHVLGPRGAFTGVIESISAHTARVETDDWPGGVVFVNPMRLEPMSNAGRA